MERRLKSGRDWEKPKSVVFSDELKYELLSTCPNTDLSLWKHDGL